MPTISSAFRSENSILSRLVSSPPKTRWRSCRVPALVPCFAAMMCPEVFDPAPTLPKSCSQVYAARAFDELGVEQWRGGDEAREAGIGQIEAEGVAVMIGHDPACLLDQQHAGSEIPIAFGGERHGGVGAACGDERKPVGDGIDPARLNARPGLLPDALLEQAAACDEESAFKIAPPAHLDGGVVEEGA